MSRRGRLFWPCVAAGWAVIVFGAVGLLRDARDTHPASFVAWFAGSALVHDLLLVPLALAIGVVVARWVPASVRPWVQGLLVTSALLIAGSFPWVAGLGDRAGNESLLPGRYGLGLLAVLALVWLVGAVGAVVGVRRVRRGPAPSGAHLGESPEQRGAVTPGGLQAPRAGSSRRGGR